MITENHENLFDKVFFKVMINNFMVPIRLHCLFKCPAKLLRWNANFGWPWNFQYTKGWLDLWNESKFFDNDSGD